MYSYNIFSFIRDVFFLYMSFGKVSYHILQVATSIICPYVLLLLFLFHSFRIWLQLSERMTPSSTFLSEIAELLVQGIDCFVIKLIKVGT